MADLESVAADLTEQVPNLLVEHGLPGMAIGLCDRDGRVWSRGFGSTRAAGGTPVQTSTMFSVQSSSKMYAAAIVMAAVQRGLVDLDAPITRYLPDFTVNSAFEADAHHKITLRHMLSHTAGFTHEAPEGSNYLIGSKSFGSHCRSISETWLRFPVGHHYEYSNLGIDLAGWVVSRLTRLSFPELARQWLFEPLGLHRSTFDYHTIVVDTNRASGHDNRFSRLPVRVPMMAAGGLYASVDDACRFVQMHLRSGDPVLDQPSWAEMFRIPFPAPGQSIGYGLGMGIRTEDGRLLHGHNGGGFGFLSDYCWDHAAGVGVVVLTNSVNHTLQNKLSLRLLAEIAGGPGTEPTPIAAPATVTVPADQLRSLAGQYVGRGDVVSLRSRDKQLLLVTEGGGEQPLLMTGQAEFYLKADPAQRFRVLPGRDGRPGYLQNCYDGFTRYRNDVCDISPEPAPGDLSFAISASGTTMGKATVRLSPERDAFIDFSGYFDPQRLRLRRISADRYLSAAGEVLDLGSNPPTYANIPLHPRSAPTTSAPTTSAPAGQRR